MTVNHMFLECTVLQEIHDEYDTANSLKTLWDNTRGLYNGVFERVSIILSDMNGPIAIIITHLL